MTKATTWPEFFVIECTGRPDVVTGAGTHSSVEVGRRGFDLKRSALQRRRSILGDVNDGGDMHFERSGVEEVRCLTCGLTRRISAQQFEKLLAILITNGERKISLYALVRLPMV